MHDRGKYVVGDIPTSVGSQIGAVVFSELFDHSTVIPMFITVHSAGFFTIRSDKVEVFGKSISLKLESDPQDVEFVKRAVGLYF